jgi:carboxylesterase type B
LFSNQVEKPNFRGTEAARELSIKIANYWATFADTGNPNKFGQPLLLHFDATEGGSLLTLDLKGAQICSLNVH